jgi:hypothetical protein
VRAFAIQGGLGAPVFTTQSAERSELDLDHRTMQDSLYSQPRGGFLKMDAV